MAYVEAGQQRIAQGLDLWAQVRWAAVSRVRHGDSAYLPARYGGGDEGQYRGRVMVGV